MLSEVKSPHKSGNLVGIVIKIQGTGEITLNLKDERQNFEYLVTFYTLLKSNRIFLVQRYLDNHLFQYSFYLSVLVYSEKRFEGTYKKDR